MFQQIRVYVLIIIHRVLFGLFTLNELISSQFLDVVFLLVSIYHRDKKSVHPDQLASLFSLGYRILRKVLHIIIHLSG